MPSVPFSFGPQASQNVEWSRKEHRLPRLQGFSTQVPTDALNVETALDHSSAGSSMVVFVMRALSVDDSESDAPPGASLASKTLSRIAM